MKLGLRLALSVTAGVVGALLMGAFAVSLSARSTHERNEAMREYGGRLTRVLVAKRDIKAGSRITAGSYERRSWVSELLPRGAVEHASELKDAKASDAIYAGEPITKSRLSRGDTGELEVPAGLVAVSIPVQTEVAVGGAIHRGDRVSVVVYDGTNGATRLVDDVLVLATSADSTVSDGGGLFSSGGGSQSLAWVTVAVDPGLELSLVNVSEGGRIHLTVHGERGSVTATSGAAK